MLEVCLKFCDWQIAYDVEVFSADLLWKITENLISPFKIIHFHSVLEYTEIEPNCS